MNYWEKYKDSYLKDRLSYTFPNSEKEKEEENTNPFEVKDLVLPSLEIRTPPLIYEHFQTSLSGSEIEQLKPEDDNPEKEIEERRRAGEKKKGSLLSEFLWISAGADRKLLRTCPFDQSKYSGIGGTILFTALMAAISASYACYFIFDNYLPAIGFGIFWGLLIFNLDRFIVNSMYSDGTTKITLEELKGGLPRIIMACFLGIIIATPLKIKLFEDVIHKETTTTLLKEKEEQKSNIETQIKDLEKKIGEINNYKSENIENVKEIYTQAHEDYRRERYEGTYSGRAGYGERAKELEEIAKKAESDYLQIKNRDSLYIARELPNAYTNKDTLENRRENIQTEIDKLNNDPAYAVKTSGFTHRYKILHTITHSHISPENGEEIISWWKPNSLGIVSIFITLLFVLIEIAPVIFKMMIPHGTYEYLIEYSEKHNQDKYRYLVSKTSQVIPEEIKPPKGKEDIAKQIEKSNEELITMIINKKKEVITATYNQWAKKYTQSEPRNPETSL